MNAKSKHRKSRTIPVTIITTVVLTLLIAGTAAHRMGYLDMQPRTKLTAADETAKAGSDHTAEKKTHTGGKILYWRAPMNPSEIYDKPGKSAMGMDLVPVYEDQAGGGAQIKIDPVTEQNMGIRTDQVRKGRLTRTIRTYGHITADETRTVQVSPKTNGWIEKLYVDFTGKFVEKGAPLFEFYSPDLVAAQEEYLVAQRTRQGQPRGIGKTLLDSALRRLKYFDVAESEIRKIQTSGRVKKALMIRSPFSGFVIEKNVEEGVFVKVGARILRIADLSRVWVEAHIYEFELPWVREGLEADMTLSYLPGKTFSGKVTFVYPYLQPKTRDVVIRVEFENPDLELKPDMYAEVRIKSVSKDEGLIILSEAVIRSGERNLVFVVREKGKFSPRDVILGRSLDDGRIEIMGGLIEGESVVISGQFLLDSESKLKEAVRKMIDAKMKKKEDEDFFEDIE